MSQRLIQTIGASVVWFALLVVGALIYTSTGGAARELLIQELLVNVVLVLGLQVFIGSTGILSFGHLAFAQVAAYGAALVAVPVATKATALPNLPLGLGDVSVGPFWATLIGTAVAVAVGAVVGIAVARAGGLAATMITLAVLFVVDQVVKNWTELTKGAGGLSGVPRITTNSWLWLAALVALVVAHWFRRTATGRFAVAARDDELAAASVGIDQFWPRWRAWVVSIGLVGLAGALRVQSVGSTNPKQYTLDVGVLLLAMLVAGGMRTVTGAFVGTVLVTAGNEAFRQLGARWEIERLPELFLALLLLAVMLLRPGGLLGDLDLADWWQRRWPGRQRPAAADGATPAVAAGAEPATTPALDLVAEGIVVDFGGFRALRDARVRVRPGEVVGLIGPNGAGKTTLFNVITGLVPETAGTVRLGDHELTHEPPHRIARAGLARTFQNLRLFSTLSVRENVAVAALSMRRHGHDTESPAVDVDELLASAGLAAVADRPAGTLDYGNQRRLELARAAAMSPRFLLLDEPTSGMSVDESLAMVEHVRATARRVGAGVLVIDHDLGFISRISDHMVVLAEGAVLAEGTPAEVQADPAVADAYLGRSHPVSAPDQAGRLDGTAGKSG